MTRKRSSRAVLFTVVLSSALLLATACFASGQVGVIAVGDGSMRLRVQSGSYAVSGRTIEVPQTVDLDIALPERVAVTGEKMEIGDKDLAFGNGPGRLQRTLGPVDTFTALSHALVPQSLKVSSADGATIYREGQDYLVDPLWGCIWRAPGSAIPAGASLLVDYEVYLQRIDIVQASEDGGVSVKRGASVAVCPEIPKPDKGAVQLAAVFVKLGTTALDSTMIYPAPSVDCSWRDFVRTIDSDRIGNTRRLLREGKPVTVVCWGDSVTWGCSPSSHDKCYVELFRRELQSAYPRSKITLINAGIGGSSTESRLPGFEKEVLDNNPDLITVEFVNDWGLPVEKITANWAEFAKRARARNPKVEFIILTPHFIMPEWMGSYAKAIAAMRKAADDNGMALGDTANIWANLRDVGIPYESLLANGINHPNDLGHEFFAETLMTLLSP